MEGNKKHKIFAILIGIVVIAFLFIQINGIDKFFESNKETSNVTIENAIRKAALECYALEGSFPPSVEYLQKNYGLMINDKAYFYHYEANGSNILPDIKVIRKWGKDE